MSADSSISEQAAAGAVCASLHRAYRDLRFYPPEHPMARRSLDALIVSVETFTHEHGDLTLDVGEGVLSFEGEPVYSHESGRDNLAFLMFRDGMRTLTVYRGVEASEIEALVDCLAHVDDLVAMEHDLVTALWEQDFAHIDYRVADPFLGGEVLREGMVDALRETVLRRLEDTVAAPGAPPASPAWSDLQAVDPDQIDHTSIVLTKHDVERGEHAVESLADVLKDFSEVLLELAVGDAVHPLPPQGADTGPDAGAASEAPRDSLTDALIAAVKEALDEGDIESVSALVERLGRMEAEEWGRAGLGGEVVRGAVTADHIRALLQRSHDGTEDSRERIPVFLALLRPWIAEQLLQILVEVDDRGVRRQILELLGDESGVPWHHLEPLLRDSRWYVVRNAVQLAAAAPHMEITEHSQRLLAHPDVRVRREMLRALEKIGGETALRGMTGALTDEDSSVRTLAARNVGRDGGSEQEAILLARIEDRGFALLPVEEAEAFLGAYAALAQDRAVHLLDRLWRKKLLSSRPAAFRAAAVLAFGRVRTSTARSILVQASKSGEAQIQRAAMSALQMQAAATSGERQ